MNPQSVAFQPPRIHKYRLSAITLFSLAMLLINTASASAWEKFSKPEPGQSQSVGKYSNGCLLGGKRIPSEGKGYQVVRMARNRHWGHPVLVDYLQDLGKRVARADLGTMLVADTSMPKGGRFATGHRSHQSGLDADIWLRLDAPKLPAKKRQAEHAVKAELMVDRRAFKVNQLWGVEQALMVKFAADDKRVARIFVHPAIKADLCARAWPDRSWLQRVRPWWGHDAHFHVRLHCPKGDKNCKPQAAPPPGDGCGAELKSWWPKKVKKKKPVKAKKKKKVRPPPPTMCQAILDAQGTG